MFKIINDIGSEMDRFLSEANMVMSIDYDGLTDHVVIKIRQLSTNELILTESYRPRKQAHVREIVEDLKHKLMLYIPPRYLTRDEISEIHGIARRPDRPKFVQSDIKNVIFNDPATIVFWMDDTKTVVKAQDDEPFDPEKGLAMAISKKALGNQGNYYNVFTKWCPEEEEIDPSDFEIKFTGCALVKDMLDGAIGQEFEFTFKVPNGKEKMGLEK